MLLNRHLLLFMLIVFIVVVGIRASVVSQSKEYFSSSGNVFMADISAASKFFSTEQPASVNGANTNINGKTSSDMSEAQRQALAKWNECNIFKCKNDEYAKNYDAYLRNQLEQLARDKEAEARKLVELKKAAIKSIPRPQCPTSISYADLQEEVYTDDEKEAMNKIEDLEGQQAELTDKLKQLEDDYNIRKREIDDDMNTMQMLKLQSQANNKDNKDMKFYETAVDVQVKPWQKMMEKLSNDVGLLQQKVDGYDPSIKSIPQSLQEIKTAIANSSGQQPSTATKVKKTANKILEKVGLKKKKKNDTPAPAPNASTPNAPASGGTNATPNKNTKSGKNKKK
jgi:uncharacterized protein YoxC